MTTPIPVTKLFQGFNTFNGSGMSTAVTGTPGSGGTVIECNYTVCTDVESVMKSLKISASASYGLGFDSVDAKASFVGSFNITTYSVSVVVYTNIISNQSSMTDVHFQRGIDLSNLAKFCAAYGDSFVSNIVVGGEYMALYVFYAQNEQEQATVKTTLNLQDTAPVTADLQAQLDYATQHVQVRWSSNQLITGFSKLQLPSPTEMVSFALSFSQNIPDAPVVIEYGTTGYEVVPDVPDFSQIMANRKLYLGGGGAPGLAQNLLSLIALNNQVAWLEKKCYVTYKYTADTELTTKGAQSSQDEKTLSDLIGQMADDPTKSYSTPTLPSLAYGSPSLTFTLLPGDPEVCWGNNYCTKATGGPFTDVTYTDILNQVVPVSILLQGSRVLDQMTVTYTGIGKKVHGGTGGSPASPLDLQQGEFITSIDGTAGDDINQLHLVTSGGQDRRWPTSPESAPQSFSWAAKSGQVLVGFKGRAGTYKDGQYVYELQPLVLTLSPATWS